MAILAYGVYYIINIDLILYTQTGFDIKKT